MGTADGLDRKTAPSFVAYLLGSVAWWMVTWPIADRFLGEQRGLGISLAGGAIMGVLFALTMFPFERWLERRKSRSADRPGSGPAAQAPPPPADVTNGAGHTS